MKMIVLLFLPLVLCQPSFTVSTTHPSVNNFGLFSSVKWSENVGVDLGLNMDLGMSYTVPYYTDRQYLVLGTDLSFMAGGRNWLTFMLYFMRITFNLEINGFKVVPSVRLLYDIIEYNSFCFSSDWLAKALAASLRV